MKKILLVLMFGLFIGGTYAMEVTPTLLYTLALKIIAEWRMSPDELLTVFKGCEKNNKKLKEKCWEVVKLFEAEKAEKEEKEVKTEEQIRAEIKQEMKDNLKEEIKEEVKEEVKAEIKAEEEEKKRLEEEARLEEEKRKEEEFKERCIQNWRMHNIKWEMVCIQPITLW